jgi:hypothetical protein
MREGPRPTSRRCCVIDRDARRARRQEGRAILSRRPLPAPSVQLFVAERRSVKLRRSEILGIIAAAACERVWAPHPLPSPSPRIKLEDPGAARASWLSGRRCDCPVLGETHAFHRTEAEDDKKGGALQSDPKSALAQPRERERWPHTTTRSSPRWCSSPPLRGR